LAGKSEAPTTERPNLFFTSQANSAILVLRPAPGGARMRSSGLHGTPFVGAETREAIEAVRVQLAVRIDDHDDLGRLRLEVADAEVER
jgi:hypothetical protein